MHTLRRAAAFALALAAIAASLPAAAGEERSDTIWVTTFDQDFYNWATPHEATFEFPPAGMPWSQILLYYTIECPGAPADCDPWDRLGYLRVVETPPEGGEVLTEVARIVTPYDITGGDRPGSCTWILDVTDYQSLLHDSVTLRNYIETWIGDDRGWLVTIRFAFLPGVTELEPYQVVNLYQNDYLLFGDPADPVEDHLQPVNVEIDAEAAAVKVKAIATGHGQGNTDNAAEFSRKWHEVVAGTDSFSHTLWRDDCSQNECSPQGGTWRYQRAGWCPGDKVDPWDVDVTGAVTPGETAVIDYNIQPYENFCRPTNPDCVSGVTCTDCEYNSTGHTPPIYSLQVQLVSYRQRSPSGVDLLVLAGPGPAYGNPPRVRLFPPAEDAEPQYEFDAYGPDHYGVNVACGRVAGGLNDVVLTGAGPAAIYGPHVRGFQADGAPVPGLSFLAYGTPRWGVNVAAGDIDADGYDEIVTGAGPGAVFGPHVRAFNFDGSGTVTPVPGVSFFAYGTPRWGVNVAAGDVDGDGFDEIVTGAGPGPIFGAHVRGWNVDGGAASPIAGLSFFAYGTPRYGVVVSCGDVDGDGIDEIVSAPGPSPAFGAHVRGWNFDGTAIAELPGLSFFAWPPAQAHYGARIAADANLDGGASDEIVVGAGPDPAVGSPLKVFTYDGTAVAEWFSLDAFPGGWTHGTTVAAGWF